MRKKISNTQIDCFNECSELYRLKYIERWRSKIVPSPLFFGSALDEAFEVFLLTKKEHLTERELDLLLKSSANEVFEKKMNEAWENNAEWLDFFASDFDPLVFKAEDLKTLKKKFPSVTDFLSFHEQNKKTKLVGEEKLCFNYLCWLSLFRKGELLLEAYKNEILPQIYKVHSIQKEIELKNDTGDILTGKIDFEAEFVGEEGVIYVCDNKTSSQPYAENSVRESQQLSIYTEAQGTNKAAYCVVEKKIRKTEPKTRTQVIKDTIPEETYQKVFTKVEETLKLMYEGKFEKKELSKQCFSYGKICQLYGLCWGGDTSMLYKKERE